MFDTTSTGTFGESSNQVTPGQDLDNRLEGLKQAQESTMQFDTPPIYRTEDGDEFITIREASRLVGASEKSVQRYANELKMSDNASIRAAVRQEIRPEGGYRKRISRRFVTQRFLHLTNKRQSETENGGHEKVKPSSLEKEVIELNKRVLEGLTQQRDHLLSEVDEKNKQIDQLHNLLQAKEVAMARLQGMEMLPDGSVKRLGVFSRLFRRK